MLISSTMLDEPTIFALLERARSYAEEGKHLHAIQIYQKLVSTAPGVEPAWMELARVYIDMRRYDAAEKTLVKALDVAKEPEQILLLLGTLHRRIGDPYRALFFFRKLVAIEHLLPASFRAHLHFNLALLYGLKKKWSVAEHHLRMTHQFNPNFPRINESLGELLVRRGAVAESIRVLRRAVSVEPYGWFGHYLLGVAYEKEHKYEQALNEFVTAVEMDPKEPRGWQMCGKVLLSLHELDESEEYLRKALELNPHLTDAVVDFGYLSLQRGDVEKARQYFGRALKAEPRNEKALQGQRELQKKLFLS